MKFADYQSIQKMNASTLVHGFRAIGGSMRKLKAAMDGKREEPTSALSFGNKYHSMILEPEEFETAFCVMPNYAADERNVTGKNERSDSWSTKFCKESKAAFERQADQNGQQVISRDEYDRGLYMLESLMSHKEARRIIESSRREVEVFGVIDGVDFKGRIDLINDSEICDLKGTQSVVDKRFGSQAAKLGYGFKLAIYRELVRQQTGCELPVSIIAIESDGDYDTVVYDVPEVVLDEGLEYVRETIAEMKQCQASGIWHGHDRGESRLQLYWPNYAMRDSEETPLIWSK